MIVRINGQELDSEMCYCEKHNCWYQADDEGSCCNIELEARLVKEYELDKSLKNRI